MTEPMVDDALVEKVARAMCVVDDGDPDGKIFGYTMGWEAYKIPALVAVNIAYGAGVTDGLKQASEIARLSVSGLEITGRDDAGWPTTVEGAAKHGAEYIQQQIATAIRQRGE